MAKKADRNNLLNGVVAGIWIGVALMAAVLLFIFNRQNAAAAQEPAADVEAAVIVEEAAALPEASETPIPTTEPTSTPTSTLIPPTATMALIPTRTATPDVPVTPVAFASLTPTYASPWEGPIEIGYSVQGRPIEVYRFGTGPDKYLVIGGIHGGYEINTIYLTDQLIKYFKAKPDTVPTNATLFIIRSLNPDGEALPHKKEGRSNANLVDLNRSFPVGWSATWDRDGCWDLMELNAGEFPASEPETVALMAFVLENPVIAVVSYHAAAPGFYPAGEPLDPNSIDLSEYLSQVTGYPYPAFYTGCYMTGSLVDWTLSTGAAGVDVELSTHWDTEFDINLNLVLALIRWHPDKNN